MVKIYSRQAAVPSKSAKPVQYKFLSWIIRYIADLQNTYLQLIKTKLSHSEDTMAVLDFMSRLNNGDTLKNAVQRSHTKWFY
ncbi:unnamed protein product [Blepharisma stoltei]|uniref:Uncharacterized protein n=1 Tax=Blepharisma stoltei TaxID=1481888 RepID=A0AAU9K671_9CILI|nr:unnamed protein product [Blepharisma stoltei]